MAREPGALLEHGRRPAEGPAPAGVDAAPVLRVCWRSADVEPQFAYRVAGRHLVADEALPGLEGFETSPECGSGLPWSDLEPPESGVGRGERVCFEGTTTLDSAAVGLRVIRCGASYRVEVEGLPPFRIASSGRLVTCEGPRPRRVSTRLVEGFLGPVLIPALALGGTFCLHASAVVRGGQAVAFVGDSGCGKSTLARMLERLSGGWWRRAADDILPIRVSDGRPRLLPRFPQLKLAPAHQPHRGLPDTLELAAVFAVSATSTSDPRPCRANELTPMSAMTAVVGNTVAARLFDRDLLEAHLAMSRAVVGSVPVYRLTYPHRTGSIVHVQRALEALADLPPGSR